MGLWEMNVIDDANEVGEKLGGGDVAGETPFARTLGSFWVGLGRLGSGTTSQSGLDPSPKSFSGAKNLSDAEINRMPSPVKLSLF
jgi:hypothetical protein